MRFPIDRTPSALRIMAMLAVVFSVLPSSVDASIIDLLGPPRTSAKASFGFADHFAM